MSNNKMICPFCHKELVKGKQRKYETLIEHIDCYNQREYPLRDTYVCSCEKSKDSFWDKYGSLHSHRFFDNINTDAIKIQKGDK